MGSGLASCRWKSVDSMVAATYLEAGGYRGSWHRGGSSADKNHSGSNGGHVLGAFAMASAVAEHSVYIMRNNPMEGRGY